MIFIDYIRKFMGVYIDDMLVKSLHTKDHLDHLKKTFAAFRKYNMKMNPKNVLSE